MTASRFIPLLTLLSLLGGTSLLYGQASDSERGNRKESKTPAKSTSRSSKTPNDKKPVATRKGEWVRGANGSTARFSLRRTKPSASQQQYLREVNQDLVDDMKRLWDGKFVVTSKKVFEGQVSALIDACQRNDEKEWLALLGRSGSSRRMFKTERMALFHPSLHFISGIDGYETNAGFRIRFFFAVDEAKEKRTDDVLNFIVTSERAISDLSPLGIVSSFSGTLSDENDVKGAMLLYAKKYSLTEVSDTASMTPVSLSVDRERQTVKATGSLGKLNQAKLRFLEYLETGNFDEARDMFGPGEIVDLSVVASALFDRTAVASGWNGRKCGPDIKVWAFDVVAPERIKERSPGIRVLALSEKEVSARNPMGLVFAKETRLSGSKSRRLFLKELEILVKSGDERVVGFRRSQHGEPKTQRVAKWTEATVPGDLDGRTYPFYLMEEVIRIRSGVKSLINSRSKRLEQEVSLSAGSQVKSGALSRAAAKNETVEKSALLHINGLGIFSEAATVDFAGLSAALKSDDSDQPDQFIFSSPYPTMQWPACRQRRLSNWIESIEKR